LPLPQGNKNMAYQKYFTVEDKKVSGVVSEVESLLNFAILPKIYG